jgi:hypothetical protein
MCRQTVTIMIGLLAGVITTVLPRYLPPRNGHDLPGRTAR